MTAGADEATAIDAVSPQWQPRGFRLLVLRELLSENEPPAFAFIAQRLLRTPQRLTRHGLYFGRAFAPDVMAWLIEQLGRPARHDETGKPIRNARWPVSTWHREPRQWPGGVRSIEWFVDVTFQDDASWAVFRAHWYGKLTGESDET